MTLHINAHATRCLVPKGADLLNVPGWIGLVRDFAQSVELRWFQKKMIRRELVAEDPIGVVKFFYHWDLLDQFEYFVETKLKGKENE